MNTDRAPSAAEHECPGGCGTEVPANLFACTACFRKLPHRLRQNLIRTRPLKYLDAARLEAIHAAEDFFDALHDGPQFVHDDATRPAMKATLGSAITLATEAALEKKELSNRLGQACAVEYARRKDQLPGTTKLPAKHRGKR